MNKSILLIVIFLFSAGCKMQEPEIGIKLSYYNTDYYSLHYLRCTVTNYTDEKLYLPHFRSYISVFEGDVDITAIFHENFLYFGGDYDSSLIGRMEIDTLATGGYRSIPDIVYQEEEKIFLELNKIDTTKINSEIGGYSPILDFYCRSKYDGLLIDAHETIELYEPIHLLFDDKSGHPKSNYTIKFRRHNNILYSMYDTVKVAGYKFYTPLLKTIGEYRIYDGTIDCKNAISLNK